MRCLIIGICQLEAVSKILLQLPAFRALYPETKVYLVFALEAEQMERILREEVPQADLIISQPVSRSYKGNPIFSTGVLRASLREGARHLVVSNCYFTGYDPAPFQTTGLDGETIHKNRMSYYPALALPALLEQSDVFSAHASNGKNTLTLEQSYIKAARDWCNPEAYTSEEVEKNAAASLHALREREKRVFEENFPVDVTISDFIEKEWRRQHLFHTYNHPTNALLFELTRRVAAAAGVPWSWDTEEVSQKELLGEATIPPPPSVYLQGGFTFPYPPFVLNGEKETTRGAMRKMADSLRGDEPALRERWLSDVKSKLVRGK